MLATKKIVSLGEFGDAKNIGNSEYIDSYWILPSECKDLDLAISYSTNSGIESIKINRNSFVKIETDEDTVIDKLLVEEYLQNAKRLLFKKDMYVRLDNKDIVVEFLK